MHKLLLSLLLTVTILACSTSKQIEKAVSIGNYDLAINEAIGKLRTNKNKKGKAEFIILLQDAYGKANERDLTRINFLKQDNNPENYVRIYDLYHKLNDRQERIKPLLPLYLNGKAVKMNTVNYANEIIAFKNKSSQHLYNNALTLLKSNNKMDARYAFEDLQEIEHINPNFKDVRQLIEVAHNKGTDFVLVDMINDTEKIIPERLENDLLNFSTYGLNNLWTVYHSNADKQITYDYSMRVNLREINISPEQVKERQIIKEKQVVDGWQYLLDDKGNAVKDSLGNKIKVDKMKTVRCEYYEFKQFKAAQVTGNIEYNDLKTKQLIDAFPLTSEYVFEHIYATSRGDQRALETQLLPFLKKRRVPFPTAEQMVYDTGENLKQQLKNILNSYSFKR
ncbi:hypothetical protein [Snuella sedimenti]|uniref:Lipoprotein n=1 Tax=Snuella sedimenti TaxID=2798802 RepID=A0A8J7LSY0_9FLAO|nr:hypothetical protein [Snuella sedimenti]MBJ6368910.1 hypothetical protein [Snuella sedimenti]